MSSQGPDRLGRRGRALAVGLGLIMLLVSGLAAVGHGRGFDLTWVALGWLLFLGSGILAIWYWCYAMAFSLGEGGIKRNPDPFGRPSLVKPAIGFGLLLLMFGGLAMVGPAVRGGNYRPLLLMAGFFLWWGSGFAALWYRPSFSARPFGAGRRLQFSVARRSLATACCVPIIPLLASVKGVPTGVGAAIGGTVAVLMWIGTGVHVDFDEQGVELSGGLHRRRRIAWGEVAQVYVFWSGAFLFDAKRRRIGLSNRQIDGYPELAAALLRYLSPATRGLEQGRPILEIQAALVEPKG